MQRWWGKWQDSTITFWETCSLILRKTLHSHHPMGDNPRLSTLDVQAILGGRRDPTVSPRSLCNTSCPQMCHPPALASRVGCQACTTVVLFKIVADIANINKNTYQTWLYHNLRVFKSIHYLKQCYFSLRFWDMNENKIIKYPCLQTSLCWHRLLGHVVLLIVALYIPWIWLIFKLRFFSLI